MPHRQQTEGKVDGGVPITSGTLVKWGGFLIALVGGLITLVTWAAKTSTKVEVLEAKIADVDKESLSRHERQEVEISELKSRVTTTDKTVNELSRKLDVVVALLERIEKRVTPDKP